MSRITTAVILAAGMGTRLKEQGAAHPKGFLSLGGVPIIERSIKQLIAAGINRILIGTGYRADFYDRLKTTYSMVSTVHNPDYALTGSLYTLFRFRDIIRDGFLLLESDLLYETLALESLLDSPKPDLILASGFTHSGDEVYMDRSDQGNLFAMSKDKSVLLRPDCELVGISKISAGLYTQMMEWAADQFEAGQKQLHYEDALVGVSRFYPIPVHVVENLIWCEIDDADHLKRATELIYPKIHRKV